nr:hypothetical protein [Tanacetum cinerariifolium]
MINSIKNGDQPLPRVTQVSIAGTASTEQPPLKDKSMWSDQEKRVQKIDRLAISLLIQGLSNDIYSLIDSNKTAKDLWDALSRHMRGSEYGEQVRKVAVLYEYETFKATEGELLLDTYIRYLQNKNLMDINIDALYNILKQNQGDVNDAMGSKKKIVVVTSDPLPLIAEKTNVSRSKDKVVVSSDSEGNEANNFNCKKAKAKDYEYYKTKMLLAKKDKDEQVLLAEDQALMESSSDSDQEINVNMVFMAQIEKVLSDSEASSSSADEKISEVPYYFPNQKVNLKIFHDAIESASENFIENHIDSQKDYNKSDVDHNDSEEKDQLVDKLIRKFNKDIAKYQNRVEKANQQSKDFKNQNKDLQDKYDVLKNQTTTFEMNNKELNEKLKELIEKNNDLLAQTKLLKDKLQVEHVMIDTHIANQQVLYDKMSVQLVELDKQVRDHKNTVLEKDFKISELEECVRNKYLEIENYLERLNVCENKIHKIGQTNQTVHMIMPSKDNLYNGRKGIGFKNLRYYKKAKDLRPMFYDEKVIGLWYTLMFLTHSDEALEIKKFKRSRENKIEFAYDYGNLNESYVNEKINLEDDYFQEIINLDFDKIDSSF